MIIEHEHGHERTGTATGTGTGSGGQRARNSITAMPQTDHTRLLGASGTASLTVVDADLATALGSGDVEVLGTPRLVALCEEATTAAVAGLLPEGMTTVGTRVEFDHRAPNRVGDRVKASAVVTSVDGRRITFTVEARHETQVVGGGVITRAVVERSHFG